MDIGTIEPPEEGTENKPKRSQRSRVRAPGTSGSGPDDGGGGDPGNNGNGDKGPKKSEGAGGPTDLGEIEKSKVLMWFLLLVVLMTFGGLISAYVVIATNANLEWRPFELPFQVWVSTGLIFASSFTYHFGKKSVLKKQFGSGKKWFVATGVLGAMFISSQVLAWMALVDRGLYLGENQYAGFFYILTAVHAIHVIGGIGALCFILLKTWNPPSGGINERKYFSEARAIGWYWHTMDGLWLVLLFLLGFWK